MRIKLIVNEFGLRLTEDKLWGILQLGPKYWQVQARTDPNDCWDWEIIGFAETLSDAMTILHNSLPEESGDEK